MRYADPHACPDCRGRIAGDAICPHCGFDLSTPEARELWQTFVQADRLVARGRRPGAREPVIRRVEPESRADEPSPGRRVAFDPAEEVAPTAGAPTSMPLAPGWSTGSILLGLGAACLIVAGIIFVTVTWGSLGLLGRAAILLVITAIVGVCAAWATRRRLRGTAESLWAVFLALIAIDVFAAAAEGLFGLEWDDIAWVTTGWAVATVATGTFLVRWAREPLGRDLVTPQLAVGASAWIAVPTLSARLDQSFGADAYFWATAVGLLFAVAIAAVAIARAMRWATWIVGALVSLLVVALAAMATAHAWTGAPQVTFGDALPMLTMIAAAAVVGLAAARWRVPAAASATAGIGYLVFSVVLGWALEHHAHTSTAILALALLSAVVALLATRADGWSTGARWSTTVGAGVVVLWLAVVATANLERIDSSRYFIASQGWWNHPDDPTFAEGWRVLVAALALAVVLWAAGRWASLRLTWSPIGRSLASVVVGVGLVTAVASTELPFLVHATVLVVVGVALAFLLGPAPAGFGFVPLVFVALAPFVVSRDRPVTAFVLALVTVGFAACSLVGADRPGLRGTVSATSTGLTAAAAIATGAQWIALAEPDSGWVGVGIVSLSAAALLVAMALDEWPSHRAAVEFAAGLGLLAALGFEADDGPAVALILTIGAVASGLVGILDEDRRWFRWVGLALVGAAWIVRLAASDVTTVEAYTAPFAIGLLAAGAWRLHTDPRCRTWRVLAPGLTMALLPSLPQAIDEPTSPRALALGLVALASLAAGVVLRWGAPLVAGAAVLAVLLLVNVGPTAAAVPRWILIAIAGVVLLAVGTTWEKRIAEGRAVVARIRALR